MPCTVVPPACPFARDEAEEGAREDGSEPSVDGPSLLADPEDLNWTVVHSRPVNVRQARSLQSRVLGTKVRGAVVRGRLAGEWLQLLDEPGFMRARADFCPFLLRTVDIGDEYKRLRVTDMFDQLEKELHGVKKELPRLSIPPRAPLAAAAAAETSAGRPPGEPQMTVSFGPTGLGGQSAEAQTESVKLWLRKARSWLKRLDPRATVPSTSQLPRSAANWEPAAAVLSVLTQGHFDPQRDVPDLATRSENRQPGLLSVCCSTSDRRRSFHPLIYENFQRQTYEPRELVVVHTGEMPSEFFTEKAQQDPRVIYRFFPATSEAPGSPRITDEQVGNPWDAVLGEDDPAELTHWGLEDPWKYEVHREGWTKGMKRNVACCIARGSVLAHFDDGCLYAPEYLSKMYAEITKGGTATTPPTAICPSRWYTLGIAEAEFRLVDMKKPESLWESYGQKARTGQEADQFNHGFVYVFTRSAWELQPFPDRETIGSKDGDFMRGLKGAGGVVKLAEVPGLEALAACGWHRDATCGSRDVPANVNHSQVINLMMFRGFEAKVPKAFTQLLPMIKEIASDFLAKRERYLRDLVEEHGSLQVCSFCNFAVALTASIQGEAKRIITSMPATDGYDMTVSYQEQEMKFDVFELSRAGGAVAEGNSKPAPADQPWLKGMVQRMAICRNCGFQLGWRYEPAGAPQEGPESTPKGPVTWGLVARHLRTRCKAGENVPMDSEQSRHKETHHNKGRSTVCPEGHMLRLFSTGQGNGGALPSYYVCDLCDRPARGSQHLWGCGTCDYDMCEMCRSRRL